jgi:murein tripeptide amidase MpaA
MTMCTNQVAQRFDCLAMTLEQPFKDAANHPEPTHGWSPERAADLGRAVVSAIGAVASQLRD